MSGATGHVRVRGQFHGGGARRCGPHAPAPLQRVTFSKRPRPPLPSRAQGVSHGVYSQRKGLRRLRRFPSLGSSGEKKGKPGGAGGPAAHPRGGPGASAPTGWMPSRRAPRRGRGASPEGPAPGDRDTGGG